ncbi:MAG: tetratricopeptide repeat protein [Anaerolineaceae bacterium]|nr:tetratricopeptide repeat protein [Anaerolineaceae bacterium]
MFIWKRPRMIPMLGILILLVGVASPLLAQQGPTCDPTLTAANYRDRANASFNQGDLQATLDNLLCVAELDPQDPVNHNNIGFVNVRLGNADEALAAYNQAITLDPTYITAYQNRGNLYYRLGQYDDSVADYTEAIRLQPDNARNYNERGLSYMDSGRHEEALKDYNQAITLDPTLAAAYSNRGFIFINRQQYEQALTDYNRALELNPELSPITYNDRGMTHYFMGNDDEAFADFAKAIDMDPNYDRPYNNRGYLYSRLEEYELAIADFNESLRISPNYVQSLVGRADAYYALGRGAEALADYQAYAALVNTPEDFVTQRIAELQSQTTTVTTTTTDECDLTVPLADYRTQADAQMEARDFTGMAATYTCMLEIEPDNPVLLVNRGLANTRLGDNESAVADYTRALAFDPNNATIYNNRGYAYNNLRQPELSVPDFLKALEINPDNYAAADGLGEAYYQLEQLEDALASFQRYVAIRGSDAHPDVLQLITNLEAQINLDLSNCDPSFTQDALSQTGAQTLQNSGAAAALPVFECAVQNEPENSMSYSDRGFVLYQLGNWNAALRDYAQAIEIDSTNAFPRSNRAELYIRLGKYQEAFYDYVLAINYARSVPAGLYYGLGIALTELGQYDDAVLAFEMLTSAARGRTGLTPQMLASVEELEAITGKSITGAFICDNQAVIGDVISSARDYNGQAGQALGDKDYQAALDAYNCSLVFNPFSPGAYTSRAYVYAKLGEYDAALADIERALELYPENPIPYANRGYVYNLQGRPEDGLAEAETALALRPGDGDALMVRGESYYLLGRYQEALADFQQVEAIVNKSGGSLPEEVAARLAELPGLLGGGDSGSTSSGSAESGAPALELAQTLVGTESGITLNYPDGWFGVEASADIIGLANSPSAFQTMVEGLGDSLPPPSGQFHVIIYTSSVINSVAETLDDAVTALTPTALLNDVGEVTEITINGMDARMGAASLEDRDIIRVLVETGSGIVLFRATAAPGEMGEYEATLMAMIGSVTMK